LAEELIDSISDADSANESYVASRLFENAAGPETEGGPPPNNEFADIFKTARIDVASLILASSGSLIASTTEVLSLVTSTIFAAVIVVPLTVLYYFKEKRTLKHKIVSLAPVQYRKVFEKTILDLNNIIKTYTIVKILEAALISFLYIICFYIAGLPHFLAFGLLMGFFNSISYVGFALPSVPILIYAYSIEPEIMYAVAVMIILIQLFDFFFILPNMIMKTIQVSPLTAVLLTLAGLKLFGFFGLVFALPIYLFCKIVLKSCYKLLVVMYPDTNDLQEIMDEA
jgi:predicted PurR-regulated permease PerM